jgi:hypothetical protein
MSFKMLVLLPVATSPVTVVPERVGVFFWCGGVSVTPILSGRSGSDPPKSLSYFFGAPSG